jgi:PAS domain S-box-containing protein
LTDHTKILIGTKRLGDGEQLVEMLEALGHGASGVFGTAEGISAAAEQGEAELAVIDVDIIREDDALEICSRIYEECGVPLIFVADADDEELITRTRSCRPSGYVIRPLQEQQVRLAVETGLRRRAEDRRQKFEFIASAAGDPMTLINRRHVYEAANAAYRATVREDGDIVGKRVREVWGDRAYFEIIKPKLDLCFSGKELNYEAWIDFHQRGGGYFDVVYYPYRDENGHVTHAVVVSRDITKRKEAEEALLASERRLNSIIDATPDIIYRLDPEGRIDFINNAVRRYGHDPEEMLGKPILDYIHPEDRDHAARRICERRTGDRRTQYMEVRLLSKKRHQVPMEVNIAELDPEPVILVDAEGIYNSEIPVEETFLGTQGLARDITERKVAELQIKESLREKEILLQEIHHRVKNNLQIISSLMDMAAHRIEDPHSKAVFGDIQAKVQSLTLIHTKLYASEHFSRINIAAFTLDIYNQISAFESWRSIEPETSFNLEEISLPVSTAIPACLFINEALTNIFRHAFPDGKAGRIEIEISRDNGRIRLRIADNGIGVPENVNLEKPSGMGLKLMSGIAEYQLHGNLEIERNHGTEVTLTFPAEQFA